MLPIDTILHEACTVLNAAQRHASELSDFGVTDNEIHRFRTLIVYAATNGYTQYKGTRNLSSILHELQTTKDLIQWTAGLKFGMNNSILKEFCMSS
jgi:hypothetical protein